MGLMDDLDDFGVVATDAVKNHKPKTKAAPTIIRETTPEVLERVENILAPIKAVKDLETRQHQKELNRLKINSQLGNKNKRWCICTVCGHVFPVDFLYNDPPPELTCVRCNTFLLRKHKKGGSNLARFLQIDTDMEQILALRDDFYEQKQQIRPSRITGDIYSHRKFKKPAANDYSYY